MGTFEIILTALITGVGSGAGVAVGTYFAQKTILKQMQKFEEKVIQKREERIKLAKKKKEIKLQ